MVQTRAVATGSRMHRRSSWTGPADRDICQRYLPTPGAPTRGKQTNRLQPVLGSDSSRVRPTKLVRARGTRGNCACTSTGSAAFTDAAAPISAARSLRVRDYPRTNLTNLTIGSFAREFAAPLRHFIRHDYVSPNYVSHVRYEVLLEHGPPPVATWLQDYEQEPSAFISTPTMSARLEEQLAEFERAGCAKLLQRQLVKPHSRWRTAASPSNARNSFAVEDPAPSVCRGQWRWILPTCRRSKPQCPPTDRNQLHRRAELPIRAANSSCRCTVCL